MTIPSDIHLVTKSLQALIALPRLVEMTLVDQVQDNSSELEVKFNSATVSVRSVAYQQQVGSVRQRTRIVSDDGSTKVNYVAKKIMDDTETVAQRIATTLRMYMGLTVAVK